MAQEFRLDYSAIDINKKLGVIDENKTYYTSEQVDELIHTAMPELPEVDNRPIENSENLISSGGVYNALQNIDVGETYQAGNLIKIKNNVISSTLGDNTGEIIKTFDKIFQIENLAFEKDSGYSTSDYILMYQQPLPNENEYDLYITLPGENSSIYYKASLFESESDNYSSIYLCNMFWNDDIEDLEIIDDTIPAFYIMFYQEWSDVVIGYLYIFGYDDYDGLSISMGKENIRNKYISLPENTLANGKFIKIENGEIRSTLGELIGQKYINIINTTINSMTQNTYYYEEEETTDYDNYPTEDSFVNVELTPLNSNQSILYSNVFVNGRTDNNILYLTLSINCEQDLKDIQQNGFEKKDNTLPALIVEGYYDDDKEEYRDVKIYSTENLNGATLKIGYNKNQYVTIPNTALKFDNEPIDYSSNLVTSGGIYEALREVKNKIVGKVGSGYNSAILNATWSNIASGSESLAEGYGTKAYGSASHAEGYYTQTGHLMTDGFTSGGQHAHAEGYYTKAYGQRSHAEGEYTEAGLVQSDYVRYGDCAHAEGYYSKAMLDYSHAEGYQTEANAYYSHTEGYQTRTKGSQSHAEGKNTVAYGSSSHVEGENTQTGYLSASGIPTDGDCAHAEGYNTIARSSYQHVQGKYNIEDTQGKYAHIVGNGTSSSRSNAHTLDWNGNAWYAGTVEATAIILKSSTSGSTKRFKITVDDNGTLSATQI